MQYLIISLIALTFTGCQYSEITPATIIESKNKSIDNLDTKKDIKSYTNIILNNRKNPDEKRAIGLARIYDNLPSELLDVIATYDENERRVLLDALSFGLTIFKYPISKDIDLIKIKAIYPQDKSIYEKNYIHKELVGEINRKVLDIVYR